MDTVHHRAPKGSGGVGILVKDEIIIAYKVKIVDKNLDRIIGISM